ncbi:hypothetical protein FACS1894147_02300 [Spirochaetia bacterium]|nr:hypothetical protein FACS1894147_02300 [Spirochaetia bacterium]
MEINLIVIDDYDLQDEPWVRDVREEFPSFEITFCMNEEEALKCITEKIESCQLIIVILDLDFFGKMSGVKILQAIREKTYLIPVIVFSGIDETLEQVHDLINLHARAFIRKSNPEEIVKALEDAVSLLKTNVASALEEWIMTNPKERRDVPYLSTSTGQTYTLDDVLIEIRRDTVIGKEFSQKLLKLTVDLIARNKEVL